MIAEKAVRPRARDGGGAGGRRDGVADRRPSARSLRNSECVVHFAGHGFRAKPSPGVTNLEGGDERARHGARADGLLSAGGGMRCQHDGKRSCGSSGRTTRPATRGRARPRSSGSCRSRAASRAATAAAASRSRTSSRSRAWRSCGRSTASTPRAGPRSRPTPCRASRARSSATSATTAGPCASRATCRSSRCAWSGQRRAGGRDRPHGDRAQIAERAGIGVEDVLEAREAFRALHSDSLDQPRGARERRRRRLAARHAGRRRPRARPRPRPGGAHSVLDTLDERDRTIIQLYYKEEMTQAEIGRRLGYSQMHVSRLLRQAVERLRLDAAQQEDRSPTWCPPPPRSATGGGRSCRCA